MAWFDVEMNWKFTIAECEECEEWFDKLWVLFGKPYYSKDE